MRHSEETLYNRAGEKLVGWVEECDDKGLHDELVATLLLDKAVSLSFHVFGSEKALEAVNEMMREKIRDHYGIDGQGGAEENRNNVNN